ncbi:hypothetical protein PAPYR_7849 [Paratrimastix pyriformis]|uniref:Uncharacterized protein n=1 Tax=Paratrimastix pyriformis TaxID=342808 RepID=A0ABQ8UJ30_9EUKA|nr:hypothetical protein PAPYR_7849 [Paratrimastix pyriformis]
MAGIVYTPTLRASENFSQVAQLLNHLDDFPLSAISLPGFFPGADDLEFSDGDILLCQRVVSQKLAPLYFDPSLPAEQHHHPLLILVFQNRLHFFLFSPYAGVQHGTGTKLPYDACKVARARRSPREIMTLIAQVDSTFECSFDEIVFAQRQEFTTRNYDCRTRGGAYFANVLAAWLGCMSMSSLLYATDVYATRRGLLPPGQEGPSYRVPLLLAARSPSPLAALPQTPGSSLCSPAVAVSTPIRGPSPKWEGSSATPAKDDDAPTPPVAEGPTDELLQS